MIAEFERAFGIRFGNPALLKLALTHRSYLHVTGAGPRESNERLEFLGDSVLGLVTSEHLYKRNPTEHEGQLTKTKSLLVSKAILSRRALAMGLGRHVLMSHSEVESGGRQRLSILADAFEAVIGAIYLDQGFGAARAFIERWLLREAKVIVADKRHTNYKSHLQEYVQSTFRTHPVYRIRSAMGPDHSKQFMVEVLVGRRVLGEGRGRNKKEAEQAAARDALEQVGGTPDERLAPAEPAERPERRLREARPSREPERAEPPAAEERSAFAPTEGGEVEFDELGSRRRRGRRGGRGRRERDEPPGIGPASRAEPGGAAPGPRAVPPPPPRPIVPPPAPRPVPAPVPRYRPAPDEENEEIGRPEGPLDEPLTGLPAWTDLPEREPAPGPSRPAARPVGPGDEPRDEWERPAGRHAVEEEEEGEEKEEVEEEEVEAESHEDEEEIHERAGEEPAAEPDEEHTGRRAGEPAEEPGYAVFEPPSTEPPAPPRPAPPPEGGQFGRRPRRPPGR